MREFIRHPTSVPFQLDELGGSVSHDLNTLNNVSFGGVACLCSKPIKEGATVKMRIECINPEFEITGKTAWCRLKNDQYEVGIEFIVNKDQVFHLRMIEQICHIEHYRNEVLKNEGRELNIEDAAKEWIEKYAGNFPEQ